MSVIQGEDGFLVFSLNADLAGSGAKIPDLAAYINFLNKPEYADAVINKLCFTKNDNAQGNFIDAGGGKFRIILGKEFNPVIFRGQNNDYPFMPSTQRYELFDGNERIRHAIDWIKKNEFINLLATTPYNTRTEKFKLCDLEYETDFEAVAKHYNYVSEYLDVTRNIMVAFFFAYTYFNKEKNQLLPLEDFKYNTPYLYTASLNDLYEKAPYSVENIGFQLFPRAKVQQTMSIDVSRNWDFVKNIFKKIELPKNPEIPKKIFDMFEGGGLLFPADYASRCAYQMKTYKVLQENLVVQYCEETITDKIWLREELEKLGYELVDRNWDIPEQARDLIHREIDEFMLPYLNTGFILRDTSGQVWG